MTRQYVVGIETMRYEWDVESLRLKRIQVSSSRHHNLLPGQGKLLPSRSMSGEFSFVASCGVRSSEVGLSEFCKPQVVSLR